MLFEPLPYPYAGRIRMIWDTYEAARSDVTFHTFRELSERNRSFEAVAALRAWQPTMTSDAQRERFDGQSVTANYFRVLGVSPVLGRDFQASDDLFNGPKVVLLSDALWRRHFAADNGIIGRQIKLDDDSYTITDVACSARGSLHYIAGRIVLISPCFTIRSTRFHSFSLRFPPRITG